MPYKPVTLVIFDGLGVAPDSEGNAVTRAKMPNLKNYIKNYPVMTVYASGNEVGLLFGEMGNQPGVRAVLQNRGRSRCFPFGRHGAQLHVPPVERHFLRSRIF